MTDGRNPKSLWLAGAVLAVLALHFAQKVQSGLLGEMLWMCHVHSLLISVGILVGRRWLVAVATVFLLSVGAPTYVLDAIARGETTFTSVLAHVVPPLVGILALRQAPPWPRWTPVAASAALYVALVPLSRWLTAPALNVNLAFAPWPPLASLSASPWLTWLANLGGMVVFMPAGDRCVRRWTRRSVVEGHVDG